MQLGVKVAFANVRGGSEFGYEWYEAGCRRNKPNTVADFVAGAEWLIREGVTTPKRLGIFGGSNAGLVVAAAMNKRPDLFAVVIIAAALLDLLRYHKFDLTYRWIPEYGTADDSSDFPVLLSYSPYHNIREDAAYPSVLLMSGDADNRCNPFHIRKMGARLQQQFGNNRVLVDILPKRGHSQTMSLSSRIDSLADTLAFVCDELGVHMPEADCTDEGDLTDCTSSARLGNLL
jgi:prolyl oligopeptidase